MIRIIGPPKRGELSIQVSRFVGEFGGTQPVHGFRPCLLANIEEFVADLTDRLFPGQPCPLPVNEFHGIAQTSIARDVVANRGALAAMRTTIDGTIVVRLLAGPHAIRDFADDRTADGTMRTDIFA